MLNRLVFHLTDQYRVNKTEEIIFLVSSLYFMLALNVYPSKTKKILGKMDPWFFTSHQIDQYLLLQLQYLPRK